MVNLLLLVFLFFSGIAGLIYELIWVRRLTLVFGGTTHAITTVLVAFMAGLGLGSYLAGRAARRIDRAVRVYGLLEVSIGLYALLIPLLLGVAEPLYRAIYPMASTNPGLLTAVRFLVSAIVLLIPTTCMGATLPILVHQLTGGNRTGSQPGGEAHSQASGRSAGLLYGINTLGAVFGVLLAGFVFIPGLGLANTTRLAAALNIGVGLTAVLLASRRLAPRALGTALSPEGRGGGRSSTHPARASTEAHRSKALTPTARRAVLIGFAVSGFAAMLYQLTWTRALVLSLGSSTYSFTCILAAFILGLALGSLLLARFADRWRHLLLKIGALELAIGLASVLLVPFYGRIPYAVQSIIRGHAGSFGAVLSLQLLLTIGVTIVPTLLMGAIFPLVIRALAQGGNEAAAATGRAYAANTVGTVLGAFLGGFVLIKSDVLGVQNAIIVAGILNGAVGFTLVLLDGGKPAISVRPRLVLAGLALALIPILSLAFGRWDPALMSSAPFLGQDVRRSRETRSVDYLADGVDMTVCVYREKGDPEHLTLTVNGKPDASTGIEDMTSQELIGHIPALFSPSGTCACVVGLGSGISLAAVARHPHFQRVDCLEIGQEVIEAAARFQPFTGDILTGNPRIRIIRADGRNHLLLTDQLYDAIVCEPSNPWVSGVASLFTSEFFTLCTKRLAEGGVLAVWLQGYGTSLDDFRMVVRTLFQQSDDISLWSLYYGDYLLVMRKGQGALTYGEFLRRFEEPAVRMDLYRIGLHRPANLLGRFIASGPALRKWAGSGSLHTDDNAHLEFSAPRNLRSSSQTALTEALYPLQTPVWTALFPGESAPAGLEEEIAAGTAARWAPVVYSRLMSEHKAPAAVRAIVAAYGEDPSDAALYNSLVSVRTALADRMANPDVPPLMELLNRIRPPVAIPMRNAKPADVVGALRMWARQSSDNGRWEAAADELAKAQEIEPGNTDVERERREALARIGRGVPPAAREAGPATTR